MLSDLLILLLGLALLIAGANYVTDGAVAIARRFNVSNLIIGLTVVALGSSMPDIVVCVESAMQHKSTIAVGEVVGADLFDLLLVVGVMAIIRPFTVSPIMRNQDLPILAISAAALWVAGDTVLFDGLHHNIINRSSGMMLILIFAFYMWFMILTTKKSSPSSSVGHSSSASEPVGSGANPRSGQQGNTERIPQDSECGIVAAHSFKGEIRSMKCRFMKLRSRQWFSWVMVVVGLGALVIGGNWVVDGASGLALKLGMSQAMVALTVVAIGNSLPDMVTSLTATLKGACGIAFGNIVGACIINALLTIGLPALITPLDGDSIGFVDFFTLVGSALLLWLVPALSKNHRIGRVFGIILVLLYAGYMTFTIIRG
ncbi:MAG: sodium:calcium antiporter [Bacteroides sp.]|nr:sodium:calcium antiporter [Bacteroides sp.]